MSTSSLHFLIRDGLEGDVAACMALDHSYETDYVWQVFIERDDPSYHQINFQTERLPRTMDVTYPANERRIRLALPETHGFLVAATQDSGDILGYLTLRSDPSLQHVFVHDIVVDRPYRRNKIGARLMHIARRWARERDAERMLVALHTKNYPGILFCQASGLAFCGYNERHFNNQDMALFFGQTLR
ncbi:MAG: GNAT family N-acetyltransferase [Anaerolineae bacterium]|nr:GNAT family N-acetyltransferase [Anaerolineae bacterium]